MITTERIEEMRRGQKHLAAQSYAPDRVRCVAAEYVDLLTELLEYREAEAEAERELANTVEETGAAPSLCLIKNRQIPLEGMVR